MALDAILLVTAIGVLLWTVVEATRHGDGQPLRIVLICMAGMGVAAALAAPLFRAGGQGHGGR